MFIGSMPIKRRGGRRIAQKLKSSRNAGSVEPWPALQGASGPDRPSGHPTLGRNGQPVMPPAGSVTLPAAPRA